jgi:hypothetical protein
MAPCTHWHSGGHTAEPRKSVDPFEWRNCLAFVFIQSGSNDLAISELHIRTLWVSLECKSVLHPIRVVALSFDINTTSLQ